ncbi:defensin-like [Lycorma delicatula]|uniref:defensin-like n=1 Tax=Lycorma delicatula TaxID=130591 RepID=UPI003F516336
MKFNTMSIFSVVMLMFAVFLQHTRAYPRTEFKEQEYPKYEPLEAVHLRIRRATCDLLSVSTQWVTLNHSACAGHCLLIGRRGGRCIDGVCNCRN